VSEELEEAAAAFAAALPGSVTLPAGAGKTHLLAATVCHLVADGGQVLVLTHTNAGVHAIQKRLREFGVTSGARVSTLTSFAFLLARAYPQIGVLKVPSVPIWSDSADYIAAANRVASAAIGQRVLRASFTHVLVDEYQDCSEDQHELVCTIASAIPATGIFGDPMQAIFGFNDVPLVVWETAIDRFPRHETPVKAWRWVGYNEELGRWLLAIREFMTVGQPFTFNQLERLGLTYRNSTGWYQAVPDVVLKTKWPEADSVLVLAAWKNDARTIGADLRGAYTVMEEIAGDFMRKWLTDLTVLDAQGYATWLYELTKKCTYGHQELNAAVKNNLSKGKTAGHLPRPGLEGALAALDSVVENPCFATLAAAMNSIPKSKSLRLHSHEAWYDIQAALRGAHAAGNDPAVLVGELARARDRIRHQGRRDRNRVVSRTLLVKGLEYDHVVIANIDRITDVNNLYVALTRARKSITIIGDSHTITLNATPS